MTIRTKLYGAMVVAVVGLGLLASLGFWGMSRLGDHFAAARAAADDRALALEIKYDITDLNGWQTAYGYDNGASRPIFLSSVDAFRVDLAHARGRLASPSESELLSRIRSSFDAFMKLDRQAFAAIQQQRYRAVRRIFLGPEIRNFHRIAGAADALADLEASHSATENQRFSDARASSRRLMVIAALVAGLFVAILLVTANDLARAAEQHIADGAGPETISPT